jgi:hypothetical protein
MRDLQTDAGADDDDICILSTASRRSADLMITIPLPSRFTLLPPPMPPTPPQAVFLSDIGLRLAFALVLALRLALALDVRRSESLSRLEVANADEVKATELRAAAAVSTLSSSSSLCSE